jgi:hypothetical protein
MPFLPMINAALRATELGPLAEHGERFIAIFTFPPRQFLFLLRFRHFRYSFRNNGYAYVFSPLRYLSILTQTGRVVKPSENQIGIVKAVGMFGFDYPPLLPHYSG